MPKVETSLLDALEGPGRPTGRVACSAVGAEGVAVRVMTLRGYPEGDQAG